MTDSENERILEYTKAGDEMTNRSSVPEIVAALVLAVLATGLVSCRDTDEDARQDAAEETAASVTPPAGVTVTSAPTLTAEQSGTLWRWGNVTVTIRDGSGIAVSRYIAPPQRLPPNGGPEIDLIRENSQVGINATTGELSYRAVEAKDLADFDAAIATIRVGDAVRVAALPWPFNEPQPPLPKVVMGNIRYWQPDPGSGLVAQFSVADGTTGGGEVISLMNTHSLRIVDTATGEVISINDRISEEDAEAFERWTQGIDYIGP